ncbi:MAG: hypothetical protein PWQ88_1086 [Candidatus Methanomethylophilaceae archaeon]|nr:hypothetical protein [Candidatus Methanomethylophilaceae archaeon]
MPCKHRYRLFNNIEGEWKLIWECELCKRLYICKCFKKAIDNIEKASNLLGVSRDFDVEGMAAAHGVTVEEMRKRLEGIEYEGMICELCRDVPSTHIYTSDMETDEFERRYGAYIEKTAIELIADGGGFKTAEECRRKAADVIIERYGFRPRGESTVEPEHLLKVIRELYPKEELMAEYQPSWCIRPLQAFLPSMSVAIEHRGPEHYETWAAGSLKELESIKAIDDTVLKECTENSVKLIVFPYFINVDRDTVGWKVAEARSS